MQIAVQDRCTDLDSTSALDIMCQAVPGVPLTAEWIDDPRYSFHWANTSLLGLKLDDPIKFDPAHWDWRIQGVEKYRVRERYMQFAYASTPSHYGAYMKFWLHEGRVSLVIMWVIDGYLESSGDDAIFCWAMARVDFTPEQSQKLLEDDGKWLRLTPVETSSPTEP